MSNGVKITIIGAGSAQFSMGLVKDLCLTPGLAGSTVSLMDINPALLDVTHNLGVRYVGELGADLKFEKTLDRTRALRGADFVINTASVGAHGGGGFACVHNLRFFLSVARDIEAVCPQAWLIQSANPVFEGCTLMTRETRVKVVGLCHGHWGVHEMARVLGLDPARVRWQAVGFNHVIYLTHCHYEGRDVYPMIDEWIRTKAEQYWATHKPGFAENQMSRAAIEQYKMVGCMPIGDTPRAGGWWYHTDQETKRRWFGHLGGFDSTVGWGQYIDWLERTRAEMTAAANDPKIRVTEKFPPKKTGEQIVPIIDALVNDTADYFQVNIPNNGLISRIPDDVVVEVPAYVSKRGIQGMRVGAMPDRVMHQILWPRLAHAERIIGFAKSPNRGTMLDIILHRHVSMGNRYTPPVSSYEDACAQLAGELENDPALAALLAEQPTAGGLD